MWSLLLGRALASPEAPELPPPEGVVVLWQGFSHFWERHAALGFHVPHRVSLFESRVSDVAHGDGATEATFTFAQGTGVDGDWMHPEGYVARLSSPDLRAVTGVEVVRSDDSRAEGEHPRALESFRRTITVPRAGAGPVTAAAVLQGLAFRSWCVAGDTPCHSDGIWPYRFRVRLEPCADAGDTLACPLAVEVGRAWTPGRGGIRGIDEKPLESRMGIEVEVSWAVLSAAPEAMLALPWTYTNALPSTRAMVLEPRTARVDGLPTGFPTAAVALTGLAFEFLPPSGREDREDRGRYIGGWGASLAVESWAPDAGVLAVRHAGGLWLPRTVHRTAVAIEVDAALLLLSHPASRATPPVVARGALCSPSHGAPWYSAWDRCARIVGTDERTRQQVPVRVPVDPR